MVTATSSTSTATVGTTGKDFSRAPPLKSCLSVPILTDLTKKSHREAIDTTSTSENSDSNSSNKPLTRNVSFCHIEIREYEQTLVDNPSVSCGPALGLDWAYNPNSTVVDVDDYEWNIASNNRRRSRSEMIMPRFYRERKLQTEWNISRAEMMKMNQRVQKARKQRLASIANPHAVEVTFDVLRSAKRKLKGMINVKRRNRPSSNTTPLAHKDSKNTASAMEAKRCLSMNDMTLYETVSSENLKKSQSCGDVLALEDNMGDDFIPSDDEDVKNDVNDSRQWEEHHASHILLASSSKGELVEDKGSWDSGLDDSSRRHKYQIVPSSAILSQEKLDFNEGREKNKALKPLEEKDDWEFGLDDDDDDEVKERSIHPGYL